MSESASRVRLPDVSSEIAQVSAGPASIPAATVLEMLYAEHRLAVVRFLAAFVGDRDKALDLTALTYERAFGELRRGGSVGLGWLLRTARNAAVDDNRRERVAELFLLRSRPSRTVVPSAEDVVITGDSAERLRMAVRALPSPQREALALRFSTDLTVREIATIVGRGEDATEKLISRALFRLREELHDLI